MNKYKMYEPNFTEQEIEVVKQMQLNQIANPSDNCLASQSMYVRDSLAFYNVTLAHRYWMAVCMGQPMGNPELEENQAKMREIDRKLMPQNIDTWGT